MALLFGASSVGTAGTKSDTLTVTWKVVNSFMALALTPNYSAGFGPKFVGFGHAPAPPCPPCAGTLNTNPLDFGAIVTAAVYLYKYAVHVNVQTASPYFVYAEGNADLGSTFPIHSSLFWMNSVPPGMADNNTGATPSTAFVKTTGTVGGGGTTITYTPPLPSGAAQPFLTVNNPPPLQPAGGQAGCGPPSGAGQPGCSDFYYDYLLRVPPGANLGAFSIYVVYTAVVQ